jgi:hypothetical protein
MPPLRLQQELSLSTMARLWSTAAQVAYADAC